MKASSQYGPGSRVPDVALARLTNGQVEIVPFQDITGSRRVLAVGVPGAFTPVCTDHHIPDLVAKADVLRVAGYDRVLCIAPNDPWTLAAWAAQVDPQRRLEFFSDGNLALARALRVTVHDPKHFLGETSSRYLLSTRHSVIERLAIEPHHMSPMTCTRAEDVLELA